MHNIHIAHAPRWDNEHLWTVELTKKETIPTIVAHSRRARQQRKASTIPTRVTALRQFLSVYREHQESIAQMISKEIGKPITQSRTDLSYDIDYIHYTLDHAEAFLAPEIVYEDTSSLHQRYFEGMGVCLSIAPRNYPSSQFVRQVIPPLLAGNTVIFKPASACILTGKLISDLLQATLPPDVFIPFYGSGKDTEHLIADDIDLIVFTGSTETGKKIATCAAPWLKKTYLELGGSAPGIILPDASIDEAMMQTMSRFRRRHGGQICDGLKRLFIHRSRYDELMSTLSTYLSTKKIGNPLDPETHLGCLVNQHQYGIVQAQLQDARDKWAEILELGISDNTPGPFMPHTLILHPTLQMRVITEEVFWPILPIIVYDALEEAIERANSTPYGLGGYLRWTDTEQIDYVCSCLQTGNINVNNTTYLIPQVPFGGYKKASGNCREHGQMGLREYCEVKVVSKSHP